MKRTRYSLQEVMKEYLLLENSAPKKGDEISGSVSRYWLYLRNTDGSAEPYRWEQQNAELTFEEVKVTDVRPGREGGLFVHWKTGGQAIAAMLSEIGNITIHAEQEEQETDEQETDEQETDGQEEQEEQNDLSVSWADIWTRPNWDEDKWEAFVEEAVTNNLLPEPAAAAAKWNWKKAAPEFGFNVGNVATAKKFYEKVVKGELSGSAVSIAGVNYTTDHLTDPELIQTESLSRGALIRRRYYGRY